MFQEMKYVYAVYQARSFSVAAQRLYVSQPSLSMMIKKAERRAGSQLFNRSTTPISLTEVGKAYIRAAEQMMEIEQEFHNYVSDAENCLTGTLSLGGTTLFTSYVLPPLISAFSAAYPGVEVRIHESHTAQLEKELREGGLDFMMDNRVPSPTLFESSPYKSERLLLAVPAALESNRAAAACRMSMTNRADDAACPPVRLDWFGGDPFLLLKQGNDTRKRADRLCAAAGFAPHVRLELDQQITAYNLSAYGLGISFVSDTLARSLPEGERLCLYALEGEDARRDMHLVYRRGRRLTRPMQAFIAIKNKTVG